VKFHLIACVPRRPRASRRERHVVLVGTELLDRSLVARLLMAELVAREAKHGEAALAEAPVQRLEAGILRGEAALARDIDDQKRLACEVAQRACVAVDCLKRDVGAEGHAVLELTLRASIVVRSETLAFLSSQLESQQ
jgi:hypothetical protein